MNKLLSVAALVGALSLSAAGRADTFNFSAVGSAGGFSGSGTLTGMSEANGGYLITGISGTGITGLIAPGGFNGNDNLLFPNGSTLVDGQGFAFADVQGNTAFQVDLYSTGPGSYSVYLKDSDGYTNTLPVTFSVTNAATPEPSSLVLLGTGVLALVGAARRRLI